MSCFLVFISDIFKATPHKVPDQDNDSNHYFVLEVNESSSVEFQNVRICGTIVDTKYSTTPKYEVFDSEAQWSIAPIEFTLDDGTATINVICSPRIQNRGDAEFLKVGSIATVIGRTQIKTGCRVVQCIGFNIHADPTQEVVHALRVMQTRNFQYKNITKDHIYASQVSLSSQSGSIRKRGPQIVPVASPAKPQDIDVSLTEFGFKRKEPATDENYDDSFLGTEELDILMNQIDKKPKLEPTSAMSEDYNFGYSSQGPFPAGKHMAQQITSLIKSDGTTLKEIILADLDFEEVEDSLSYLLSTGQIYERDGRYYLL
ncbi:hypothetical protein BGW37DRAFT_516104 [Umbelopsis sp. PMI_123]|nr:hypothetical protein BGW37DRAFT_516104 [Umbelopsis sp. PMI_123]